MILAKVLIAFVAIEHIYILYLEMFAWTKERTRKAFGTTLEFAEASKTLAANQGLYNGFLAAGLLLSIFIEPGGPYLARLFLSFVIVAALYAGFTVNRRVAIIQGAPAAAAMIATLLSS